MKFAKSSNLGSVFVEGTKREVVGDFIDDVVAKEFRQRTKAGHQGTPRSGEICKLRPILIDEAEDAIAQFGPGLDTARTVRRSLVGAKNEEIAKVSAVKAKAGKAIAEKKAANSDKEKTEGPEIEDERRRDHLHLK